MATTKFISGYFIFAIIGITFPCHSHAEDIDTPTSEEADNGVYGDLEEVVVTATRTPKALKDVPVITRVLSSEDIRKADATNIQDLLTTELPGLEFTYSMSQETALNMNGVGGQSILFLIDGERLAGETLDNIDFNRLNLENVGQVEIIKGASSALYGANAVGGVINLISKHPDESRHLNLNSRYHTAGNEWRVGGNLDLHNGIVYSNTNFQFSRANTIRLTDAFDTQSAIHYIFGGSNFNLKERLTFRITDHLRLTARGGFFNRISHRTNYDDRYRDYSAGLRSFWDISDTQSLEASYAFDQYDKKRFVSSLPTDEHNYSNRRNSLHLLYNHSLGRHTLTAGADFLHDYLLSYQFSDNAAHSQSSFDAFLQFDYNPFSRFNIVASLRDDYYSESRNNALTARLATLYKLDFLSIRLNYAGGFRAPSLKEMYMNFDMAGIQMIYGNPHLKPERSHNLNLSLEHTSHIASTIFRGSYNLNATGYYNIYNSRITTTDFPGDEFCEPGAIYCNEDGVKTWGIDLSARYRMISGFGILFNYSFLQMIGRDIDSQFSNPRPHSMTWRADYEHRFSKNYKLFAAISGRFLSAPESEYPTDGAYNVWKLSVQQEVCHGVNINFMIDNLFNYRPKVYYWNSLPTIGRSYAIGVSLDLDSIFFNNK